MAFSKLIFCYLLLMMMPNYGPMSPSFRASPGFLRPTPQNRTFFLSPGRYARNEDGSIPGEGVFLPQLLYMENEDLMICACQGPDWPSRRLPIQFNAQRLQNDIQLFQGWLVAIRFGFQRFSILNDVGFHFLASQVGVNLLGDVPVVLAEG